MPPSNYDMAKAQAAELFVRYDAGEIIAKYGLAHDENYLYLPMLNRMHRISRSTGLVEWSEDGFQTAFEADFNAAMTVYDVLCYAKKGARLSGSFVRVNSLPGSGTASRVGENITDSTAQYFRHRPEALLRARDVLGGVPAGKGDIAFQLELFPFLPVLVKFWQAEEEFPPTLQFLWDANTLNFLHYETVWYAAGYIRTRLRELAEAHASLG